MVLAKGGAGEETDPLSLHLDQTTPQTIINGLPYLSSLTQGSILFTGASGQISQDNSNLFWDNTNKRLGIGTTGPAEKLDVAGQITRGSSGVKLDLAGATGVNQAADFNFQGGGKFRAAEWDIKGTNDIFFQGVPATTAGYTFLEAWKSAGMVVGTGNTNPVILQVNRDEKVRITNTGNVGIGTTSPAEALTLASSYKIGWEASAGSVDTNLYRSAADTLKTDDNLIVAGHRAAGASGIIHADYVDYVKEVFTSYNLSHYNNIGQFVDVTLSPSQDLTSNLYISGGYYVARWNSNYDGMISTSPNEKYAEIRGFLGSIGTNGTAGGNLEAASGGFMTVQHLGSGTLNKAYGIWSWIDNNNLTNETGNINTATNYYAQCTTGKSTGIIGTRFGLKILDATGAGSLTNQYGVYIESLTKGGTNYAIYTAGATQSYLGGNLTVDGGTITLGADTNLYRSAANTLKTDDSFIANAGLTVNASSTLGDGSDTCTVKDILLLNGITSDPTNPTDGSIWYRSDTDEFRVRSNSHTYVLPLAEL